MIIGLDFDRVLFETDRFKDFLDSEIPGFLEEYPKEGNYDPDLHADNLEVGVKKIFQALEHADRFLYDDIEALEELRDDFQLMIVSRGDPYFQERKIAESGALEHVDGYFIVEDEDKDEIDIDFLVDDREEEIERVSVPGIVFDRSERSLDYVVEAVKNEFGEA
ncbi:hypothetical protein ACK3SF_00105 [Candidatus Nanosalina sp. VS9-1]|uniref:hypothetical protein n=1 Tax=Candidatus Nanosalina sp. VS9-1 TaxID=3388566 RepID=UPI0039DF678E